MSSEEDEESSSKRALLSEREGELLLAEFRRLQQEARDCIRAARDENTAYLSDLKDASTQLDDSQKLLNSTSTSSRRAEGECVASICLYARYYPHPLIPPLSPPLQSSKPHEMVGLSSRTSSGTGDIREGEGKAPPRVARGRGRPAPTKTFFLNYISRRCHFFFFFLTWRGSRRRLYLFSLLH